MFKDAKNNFEHNVSKPDSLVASHAREKSGMKLMGVAIECKNLLRFVKVLESVWLDPFVACLSRACTHPLRSIEQRHAFENCMSTLEDVALGSQFRNSSFVMLKQVQETALGTNQIRCS